MMKNAIITLVLLVLASGLGFALLGPGYLGFNTQGEAQKVIDQKVMLTEAVATYASLHGDGEVHFGDPEEDEELFVYLRDKTLIRDNVGMPDSNVSEWAYDPETNEITAVVSSEEICKYINFNEKQRPLEEPTPVCDEEEAVGFSCCQDLSSE